MYYLEKIRELLIILSFVIIAGLLLYFEAYRNTLTVVGTEPTRIENVK